MNDPRDHVISVVLSDEEWKAFVRLQPQPVAWLRRAHRRGDYFWVGPDCG